jgi:hypothetical protein
MLADESGVALGLAIILVVVIGVMGAGLLTPVIADLQATAEANCGQRAFEMAEARPLTPPNGLRANCALRALRKAPSSSTSSGLAPKTRAS